MRVHALVRNSIGVASLALVAIAGQAPGAYADTGGVGVPVAPPPANPITSAPTAKISEDGTALAPASAPDVVKKAIWAGNQIIDKPYIWGGGHRTWNDKGYDCSGAVSYVLHGAGLLSSPGDAVVLGRSKLMRHGPGRWITYYWNHQHGYMVVAGRRFDTSGPGPSGPRWRTAQRSAAGFYVRHPAGL